MTVGAGGDMDELGDKDQMKKEKDKMQVSVGVLLELLGLDPEVYQGVGTKGLLKYLIASIHLCDNRHQRIKMRRFIVHLQDPKLTNVQENFYSLMLDFASREGYVSTPSSSKMYLELLKWVTITAKKSTKLSTTYCRLLGVLLSRIQFPRLERSAERRLHGLLVAIGSDLFSFLFQETYNSGNVIALGMLIQFLLRKNSQGLIGLNGVPSRKDILELYVKECLMAKTAKTVWFLKKASSSILVIMTEMECKEILVPAIQKAMLRSPEIALEAVAACLEYISVDLSSFYVELGKSIGSSLYSKEDSTRDKAAIASRTMAEHMNLVGALKVVEWYFDIYNGAEGKLTVSAYKTNILKAIGEMGKVQRPETNATINANFIFNKGVKILESEAHEGTLIQACEMLVCWLWIFGKTPQADMVNYFKKFPTLKGGVRTAACEFLDSPEVLGISSEEQLYEFCVNLYDKSYTQIVQPNALAECIFAADILLSKGLHEKREDLLMSFWSLLSHVNEKYIALCTPSWIFTACSLMMELLNRYQKIPSDPQILFDTIPLLFTTKRHDHKKRLMETIGDGVERFSGEKEFSLLLKGFQKWVLEGLISEKDMAELLLHFSLHTNYQKDPHVGALIAIEFLPLSHMCSQQDLWVRCISEFPLDPAVAIQETLECIKLKYIQNFDGTECMSSILKTLAFIMGEKVLQLIVDEFLSIASNPDIFAITRDEFFTYLTPEDQLFDVSVIELADESGKNMKRESRVYSYKEQLEEIQLRKEMEEKRRKSGKPVVYSAKQKEAIKLQLAKEKSIRDRVSTLRLLVNKAIGLLRAGWGGRPEDFGMLIYKCIGKIIAFMKCPLSAPESVKFYQDLGKSLFQSPVQSECAVWLGLRLINPTCDLDAEWLKHNLQAAAHNSFNYIWKEFQNNQDQGAQFSFIFPTLQLAMRQFPKDIPLNTTILQIFLTTAKDKSNIVHGGATLISRMDVLTLLYGVIGKKDGVIQQLAVSSVLQLGKSVAFKDGIAAVTQKEVELHLTALTNLSKLSRECGMKCLDMFCQVWRLPTAAFDQECLANLITSVYRERFDSSSDVVTIAEDTWQKVSILAKSEGDTIKMHRRLFDDVIHPCDEVRHSASKALADYLKGHSELVAETVNALISSYQDYIIPTPPLLDQLGRVLQPEIDRWEARCGVGLAVREIAPSMSPECAQLCMEWMVTTSLSDLSPAVHNIMLEAAVEIVQVHGPVCLNEFINVIEGFLAKAGSSGKYDNVRQACVVLMGSLARHLNPSDTRVRSIFSTLIDTLSTPSEKVQESVANCLPALVPAITADSEAVLKRLLEKVMEAETFGERRGAAFGVAGMIKGLGILSLKQHDIMNILAQGMQDKKNFKHREGALMCLELLCEFLGRLFEPYIVHVLPYLLQCLGDSNLYVREATENTAKRVMSRLSAHGVKLVLPALIGALNEDSWRTKCGSVDLLGRMAYCAPKQLSGCLPMIVPRLIEVLGDSHAKVQEAGAKALGLIGSVIQNPEIQSVVPVLLEALQDPGKRSSSCLQCLLQTEFVHFVDAPSLALIMPVVQRAFLDRSTENRKMACQVIGNMYSLTDLSDLAPYMDSIMPGIRASLVDPVPEVRAVAAKALGSMAKGMGEKTYDELLPWLMKTLISESNSVDRSGAAQGLAEVIGALGEDKLHRFMPEIIKKADCDDLAPHVRDGYMMMLIYMPGVFEEAFVPYIGQIINPILKALADENEFVRETALRAGQRIVTGFAESAITLLLPELEKGIFDDNWRIRFSSIQLLGDLLYKISGVSGKMSTESAGDDDNFGTEQSQQTIISSLGVDRRNRVLAGLYMGRSDVALMVRQAALHVWKVIVANTPKTLREILPTLFSLLLGCLASPSHDKRQVAARTLGDLVRKLGEKILPEIIPILEKGLDSSRSDERQGVCIGLSEIMAATSRDMVLAFVDNLVPTLRKALCDSNAKVREAAARTFAGLHSTVGNRALEEVVPHLLKKLSDPAEGEFALDGLGQILVVKSKVVMPYLVPQLTAHPVNTKALAILASVAGDSLSKHLSKILPALLSVLTESAGTPREQEELDYCERVVLTVIDEQGVRLLVDELLENMKTEKGYRRASVTLLSLFCIHTKAEIEPYMSQLIRGLFQLMTETDEVILNLVADGLAAIVKSLDSAAKVSYVGDIRQAVRFVQSDLKGKALLPGLCTSKGISPVLPIFREALLNGGADVKEQASLGLGELISFSSDVALKPSVIHITGPLIRILGDRYGPTVKVAVLDTLTSLLMKVGIHLKAFLPQLQTTFLKATTDTNRNVRLKSAYALAELMPIHSKPDPMFMDLINSVKQAEDGGIRDTLLYTIRCTLGPSGSKITDVTRKAISTMLFQLLSSADELTYVSAAGAIGVLTTSLSAVDLDSVVQQLLLDESDVSIRQARSTAIIVALKANCDVIYSEKYRDKINKYVLSLLSSDKIPLIQNGLRACCYIFLYCVRRDEQCSPTLLTPFAKSLNNQSNEVKILMGQASEVFARQLYPKVMSKEMMRTIVPALVMGTKEKNSIVRASCESALIYLLHLRHSDSVLNACLDHMEAGAKDPLTEVVGKVLRKSAGAAETREPDIDDTVLS